VWQDVLDSFKEILRQKSIIQMLMGSIKQTKIVCIVVDMVVVVVFVVVRLCGLEVKRISKQMQNNLLNGSKYNTGSQFIKI
jgi:hypothetical protein